MKEKEIEKLTSLSRIKMEKEEKKKILSEMDSVLNYIQKLDEVNVEKEKPFFHFPELKNVVRKDKAKETEKKVREKMMKMGRGKDGYLRVELIL